MSTTGIETRRLLFVLDEFAREAPNNKCTLLLSTGASIEGNLSPYDDQSDYVRVNTPSGVTYVALAHIVAVSGL